MKRFTICHRIFLTQTALTALLASLFVLSGCFSSNPKNITAFAKPGEVDTTAEKYVLEPPDEVEIRCSKVPEIHMHRQQIRPDGKISFEGLGEIQAAGKTPAELASLLYEKISSVYTLPGQNPIGVGVVAFRSRVYYVMGQVYFPGPKEATGRDTVLTALAAARPTNLAWLDRIQVIRPSTDKKVKPKIFELNFDRMIAHGDASKNVLLQEGDIIYVPPTVLASIGLKVEELVSPIGRAFSTVNIVQGPPGSR
jgi:polysaccharide export outer membrane protein